MKRLQIKRIISLAVVIMAIVDITLLFAANRNFNASTAPQASTNPGMQVTQDLPASTAVSAPVMNTVPSSPPLTSNALTVSSSQPALVAPANAVVNGGVSVVQNTSDVQPTQSNSLSSVPVAAVPAVQNASDVQPTQSNEASSVPIAVAPAVQNTSDVQPIQSSGTSSPTVVPAVPADPMAIDQATGIARAMALKPSVDQIATYNQAVDQSMPMTPSQIIAFKQRMAASEEAAAMSPGVPPAPVSTSMFVSLAPGATPPVIRLGQGFISSLVLTDASGKPWPIVAINNGNPQAFNVSWDKKGNTVMIQALKPYTYGNIAVMLEGSSTPVMLTLVPGQKVVDYRADLRVSGLSPESQSAVVVDGLPATADQRLLNVLDGIGPQNSQSLTIQDCGSCKAWSTKNSLFLRLPVGTNLISPGYLSMMRSPDGTQVYEVRKTPTLLVANNNGQTSYKQVVGLQ